MPPKDPKELRKLRFQKRYLTYYIKRHAIWQEDNIWKSVLQKLLNLKFAEAVQKEKEKQDARQH
jgi:hypothetical protein